MSISGWATDFQSMYVSGDLIAVLRNQRTLRSAGLKILILFADEKRRSRAGLELSKVSMHQAILRLYPEISVIARIRDLKC